MTITKEQIARLRELEFVAADLVVDYDSVIPALLDEVDRLQGEGARVFDAVMELLVHHTTMPDEVTQQIKHHRERILGGGDHGQD